MENAIDTNIKNIDRTRIIGLEKGKVQPQAVDLEEAVLGAMMIDKKGIDEVIDILTAESFYKEAHQYIFEAMKQLFDNSQPVDLLTVSSQLRKNGKLDLAGGDVYLINLTQKISSSAHIEFHARVILQKAIQRNLIHISSEIIEDCFDETTDVFELIDKSESKFYEVTQGNVKKNSETAQSLVAQAIKKIQDSKGNESGLSGIASGFTKLDELTSGWQPTELIIIAARPGMGKTAFVLSMARNMAVGNGVPVALFSLEMSSVQLITRLISSETLLSSEKLRSGKLETHEWVQLSSRVQDLQKAPIYIDDTPALSIFDLRAKARRLVSQQGVKVIIIDYLQLMTAQTGKGGGNREQEISTISRGLKALAKELNVPVIALSQLSRNVESRQGGQKRPQLSDLRESGAIEQDADIVSFIYRPEYYKLDMWDDEPDRPTKGEAEFIVAKHRNGGLENIKIKFEGMYGRFTNLEDNPFGFAIESRMNSLDDTFVPTSNPFEAFGSGSETSPSTDFDDDNGIPF